MTGILQALLASVSAAVSAVTDEYFEYVTMLLPGNGTNGAQNNTFLDSSTNNFTITRNGNTTQGTFTPYGDNWSNYFDGTGDYLSVADNTALTLTANFTIECWIYPTAGAADRLIISKWGGTAEYYIFTQTNNVIGFAWGPYSASGMFGGALLLSGSNAFALNTWSHVAVVRNSNTFTLYVNGTSVATATNSAAVTDGPEPVTIGDYNGGGFGFAGYISNARIVKGTAVYTAAFTPPTAPLTAITNTSLLTCQSNRFIDNSTNAFTITRNGDVSVQRFSPFSPTAAYASGTIGGSGYFDGTGDYLSASANTAFQFGTGNFTIEFWYYPTSFGTNTPIDMGYANVGSYAIQSASDGKPYFYSGTTGVVFTATTGYTLNAWNHLAVSRSGTTLSMFINGVRVGTATNSTNFNANFALGIGGSPTHSTPYEVVGYMSNVRLVKGTAVYDPTLTTMTVPTAPLTNITNTSILCNFTNAGIIDNAMMNDLETVGNAQISTSVSKFGGSSMYFDGTGDWLVGNFASKDLYSFGTGNFTVEMWVYTSNLSNYQTLLDTRASDSQIAWCLFIDNTGKPYWYDASGVQLSSTAISSNTWTHLAIARSGSTLKMFLGGTEVFSGTNTNSQNPTGTFYVGRNAVNAFLYTGYIDDLRITKGVARYTANFTAPTAPFPTS